MRMLVTNALNELKLLDSRISSKTSNAKFFGASKKSAKNVYAGITKEEFVKNAKADYDSIWDLINRRNKIKNAIVLSNAVTKVTLVGIEYTVAEAIERKGSISYEQRLLQQLKSQYNKATVDIARENIQVDKTVESLLLSAYGKDSKEKVTEELYNAIATPYRNNNEFELVAHNGLVKEIDSFEEFIENFLSDIDTALQVSNSTTFIEIE